MYARIVALIPALSLALAVQGTESVVFDAGGATIPDNDPTGYQDTRVLAGLPGPISDLNVTLTLSGGFNGDLYVCLSHGPALCVLLNRVGRSSTNALGYADTGFGADSEQSRFTLNDQALNDVHFYQASLYSLNSAGELTGTWQPDGRVLDPASAAGSFDAAPRSNMLAGFNGLDPNGGWTLFLADQNWGDMSLLTEWGLTITTVPEPSALTLASLGAVVLMRLGWFKARLTRFPELRSL
jgi:subtilisin-like proprotein convertase family protein